MEPVVVVSETMGRRFWPDADPIGKRLRADPKGPWFTVVGVVGDVRVRGAQSDSESEAYFGYWLNPEPGINVVLKAAGEATALSEPLRSAVKDVDPSIAVAGIASMDSLVAGSIGDSRFYATLVAVFAALALVLAAVGIYGVLSYAVAQRIPEIGVRLALGAAERQIFGLVMGDSLKLALAGLAIGAAGALAVGRGMQSLLFGVAGTDVVTFAATATVLMLVAFVASYVPARRAMRVDPMSALRAE